MPSSVSLESKLDPSITQEPLNNNDFDSGFNDQDSASSQQSADSESQKSADSVILSSNVSEGNSRGSSLEKSSAADTKWG